MILNIQFLATIKSYTNNDQWIVVNTGVYGLYRVNYDLDNWQNVIYQLQEDPTVRLKRLNNMAWHAIMLLFSGY